MTNEEDQTKLNLKGCGKVQTESVILSNGDEVIETYRCGSRASEFNAVYLCPNCSDKEVKK